MNKKLRQAEEQQGPLFDSKSHFNIQNSEAWMKVREAPEQGEKSLSHTVPRNQGRSNGIEVFFERQECHFKLSSVYSRKEWPLYFAP